MASIKIYISAPTTLGELFVNNKDNFPTNYTQEEFLSYTAEGKSNKEIIFSGYSNAFEKEINQGFVDNQSFGSIVIEDGTVLYIDSTQVKRGSIKKLPAASTTDYSAFLSKNIDDLVRQNFKKNITKTVYGSTIISYGKPTCYVYSKANSAWYNLSRLHINSSWSKQGNSAGQFSLSLAAIPTVFDFGSSKWIPDFSLGGRIEDGLYTSTIAKGEYSDFISTVVQQNDLILFRFDDNEVESDGINESSNSFIKDKRKDEEFEGITDLFSANQSYDFIGLVDDVSKNTDYSSGRISINISGRDLYKMLIDDGMYFFLNQFYSTLENKDLKISGSNDPIDGKSARIRYLDSQIDMLSAKIDKNISLLIEFIFKLYGKSGHVPDEAFKKANLQDASKEYDFKGFAVQLTDQDRRGLWKLVTSVYDSAIDHRSYVGVDLSQESGSIVNFINNICAEPFVEFFGDTYGNRYFFQTRKPLYDKKSLYSYLDDNFSVDESKYIKSNSGKVEGVSVHSTKLNELFSIEEYEIIGEDLRYSNEAYSWYSVEPRNCFYGKNKGIAQFIIPALYFEAYGKFFGNKPYMRVLPYDDMSFTTESEDGESVTNMIDTLVNDVRYLVEINAYLPFTRMGTITIHGNRNLKRGYHIYNKKTDEVFYIDGISHNRESSSANSFVTTLTLTRGMKKKFIKGVKNPSTGVNYSYFNLINTEIPDSVPSDKRNYYMSNWRVNEEVFLFFLQRREREKDSNVISPNNSQDLITHELSRSLLK